jgi:hypothetical protein
MPMTVYRKQKHENFGSRKVELESETKIIKIHELT